MKKVAHFLSGEENEINACKSPHILSDIVSDPEN